MPAEVRLYDPLQALDGGEDGMEEYRKIVPQLEKILDKNTKIYFEIGEWQEKPISEIIKNSGFQIESVRKDLAGIPRVIIFHKPYLTLVN